MAKITSKELWMSKTFLLALGQALLAVVLAFQGAGVELPALLVLKSALDISLRLVTVLPIK